MGNRKRRLWLVAAAISVGILLLVGRPVLHVLKTAWNDRAAVEQLSPGYVDDFSRMNRTHVAQTFAVPSDRKEAEKQLRRLLKHARAAHLHVSVAGARHSTGGQTIYPEGVVVDMLGLHGMSLDEEKNILHVEAGARWADVIPFLEKHGRAVEIMQSDNAFTVGGSLSVNCHGWQYGRPPIAASVGSMRVMKADGTVVTASRTENQELFSLVLGGYGLFGIILDVDLKVVPNQRLRLEQYILPIDQAFDSFDRTVQDKPGISMVYARLNITPEKMFDEVIVNLFYPDPGPVPPLSDEGPQTFAREVFRGSVGSDYGKALRWSAETRIQPWLEGKTFSRNQLMNHSPEWYLDRSAATTDVLQEYFLPRESARSFLLQARDIIRGQNADLLNVTVRDVRTDQDSFLRYADRDMIAFVMFFSQPRSQEGDAAMQEVTQRLIDAALNLHGRYYLPYRLHASAEQFARAYPQAAEFFSRKRRYDPGLLFQNEFYLKYAHK